MSKLESGLRVDQIIDGIRQLSEQDQRALASRLLTDSAFENFVEELEDSLNCERARYEGQAEPLTIENLPKDA